MATPADLARGWMQKGDSDRLNADRTTQTPGPYDTACFHAQQAVEKYLKAVLAFSGSPILRTHDLEDIDNSCLAVAPRSCLTAWSCRHSRRTQCNSAMIWASGQTKRRRMRRSQRLIEYAQRCFRSCRLQRTLEGFAVAGQFQAGRQDIRSRVGM